MNFQFDLPVEIHFGKNAVREHCTALKKLGSKAYLVTGKHSGRESGALGDVLSALPDAGIVAEAFEGIGNNPTVEQCRELGMLAKQSGAEFIIGVGGGSPMDSAKAIAVFANNELLTTERLLKNDFDRPPLPVAAVPTTSGTGSEVTPWSIMTVRELETKRSFGNLQTFPRVALLDPTYTESLPLSVTRHTAMDAFQHAFESMMSHKSSPVTDALNFEALRRFSGVMDALEHGELGDIRETLMLVSLLGGCTISHTGTTILHAMGYPITYFCHLAHGHANSVMMPAYLDELKQHEPERLEKALSALGKDFCTLREYVLRNFPMPGEVNPDEKMLVLWGEQTSRQGSVKQTNIPGNAEYITGIYRRALAESR